MAALSTYMWDKLISGYFSSFNAVTVCFQSSVTSRTLALSTEHTLPQRKFAISNATLAIRLISDSE